MGVKFEKGASPIKVQSLSERPRADKLEERDRLDTLDSVRDSQLSFSADTESESNSSSTCCSSSSSTKTVSLLDRLLHQHTYVYYFNGSYMIKCQKEKNYYKNNRGSFWELENRIMGRKKRIMCGCLGAGCWRTPINFASYIGTPSLPNTHARDTAGPGVDHYTKDTDYTELEREWDFVT